MVKKILVLFQVLICIATAISAQNTTPHNFLDTAYIAPRRMSQQTEFLANREIFPAKPRDMWEFGVFSGIPYIDGDVAPTLKGAGIDLGSYAIGLGVHIRKSLGYILSLRGSFAYYNMIGLDYKTNSNLNNNQRIIDLYTGAPNGYVHNYRTMAFTPSVDALISLNNILFHSKMKRWSVYAVVGYTGLTYKTKLDLNDATGTRYPVEIIDYTQKKSAIRKQLREMFNSGYETDADVADGKAKIGDYSLRHSFNTGLGFEYRIGKKTSLNLEYKRIQTRDDYIDGYYRQSGDLRFPVFTSEWDNVSFISFGASFSVGDPSKKVQPLWWMNPLEYAYSELNNPKHMKLPAIILDDADGDGVTDQFDVEPNTPKGCPVDTHGASKDTDGDGVPDCKDKELLTLQSCFPVNADGIGNCPDASCCKEAMDFIKKYKDSSNNGAGNSGNGPIACMLGQLPNIQFKSGSLKLTKDSEALIALIAEKLRSNPGCNVRVVGYGKADKRGQQLSWDRVNLVIKQLVEKQGFSESRFIFVYGLEGQDNTVDLFPTTDKGQSVVPAPHPQLKRS